MVNYDFVLELKRIAEENANQNCLTDQDGKRTLTYGQVTELVGKTKTRLIKRGVEKGTPVIIILDRCSEYIVAELAIMQLGGIVVPLLPEYPKARVDYIQSDCKATMIITADFFKDIESESINEKLVSVGDEDHRLYIYTSGSTGNPKGVVYSNRALSENYKPNPNVKSLPMRHASMSPMSFIGAFSENIIRLMRGLHIFMISEEMRKDFLKLRSFINSNDIGSIFLPPSALRVFDHGESALKRVYVGGEKVAGFAPSNYVLLNGYGQTETLGAILYFSIDKAYDNTPLGTPKPGVEIRIVDEKGTSLTGACEGELVATGYFASGYLNREEESAKTFRHLPDGRTEVHMGDVVRRLLDGTLYFVNRKDFMVKVNGQRVDMGEVEHAMLSVSDIEAAAVRDFDNAAGQKYIVGYYVSDTLDGKHVKEELSKVLADYMMPSSFVKLDKMPLTASGKVDRMSLKKPEEEIKGEIVAPENETEEIVLQIAKEILNINEIGVTTNLQQVGMTSLSFIALSAEYFDKTGKDLPVRLFMKYEDIRGIVKGLDEVIQAPKRPAHREPGSTYYGMSRDEEVILLPVLLTPGAISWHMTNMLKITGHSIEKIKKATEYVFNVHSHLKSYIVVKDKKFLHKRRDTEPITIDVVHVDQEIDNNFMAEYMEPMELLNSELYKVVLFEGAPSGAVYMLLDIHHMQFDGYSQNLLVNELEQQLAQENVEKESYTFCDFIEYAESLENSDYMNAMRPWFEEFKRGASLDFYPFSAKTRENTDLLVASVELEGAVIEDYCKKRKIRMPMLYQNAIAQVLSRFTMTEKKLFSLIYADRDAACVKRTVGLLAKSLLVRYPASEGTLLEELMSTQEYYSEISERSLFSTRIIHDEYGMDSTIYLDYLLGIVEDGNERKKSCVENMNTGFNSQMTVPFMLICVLPHPTDTSKTMLSVSYSAMYYTKEAMLSLLNSVKNYMMMCVKDDQKPARSVSLINGNENDIIQLGKGYVFDESKREIVKSDTADAGITLIDLFGNLQPITEMGEIVSAGKATGYIGRYFDGKYEVLGKKGCVHYVNQQFVDLSVTEEALNAIDGVYEGKVVTRQIHESARICVYYTGSLNHIEVLDILKEKLAKQFVPYCATQLDKLPDSIYADDFPAPDLSIRYEEPTNELEEKICGLFKEYFSIDLVSVNARFDDLGGSFKDIYHIISNAEKIGLTIPYPIFFTMQTPRRSAQALK